MQTRTFSIVWVIGIFILTGSAQAFPPTPFHEIYGTVRDEQGNPLLGITPSIVRLNSNGNAIGSATIDPSAIPGQNYSLKVAMDAGTQGEVYLATALQPLTTFTLEVIVGSTVYVPIEVSGSTFALGQSGERTRIDLTLGIDSDGDGLPDSWEQNIIALVDGLDDLSDVDPNDDADGDGASNYTEYLAGTYPFERRATFGLDILEVAEGFACLRFLSAPGRTYRIEFSENGQDFTPTDFSLNPDGSDAGQLFLSSEIRFRDVFVPAELATRPKALFRLYVD